MNNKAQTFNIFTFMIVSFLAIVFFGGLIYAMGMINNVFHQAGVSNEVNSGQPMYVNMTQASDSIFGQMNQSIQALRLVALVYILSLGASIIITNALVKTNPLWFFAYILISLLAVIFAPTISNAYDGLVNSNIFEGTLSSFGTSNYLMHILPTLVLVISILGGIFLFINIIKSGNEGNLQ